MSDDFADLFEAATSGKRSNDDYSGPGAKKQKTNTDKTNARTFRVVGVTIDATPAAPAAQEITLSKNLFMSAGFMLALFLQELIDGVWREPQQLHDYANPLTNLNSKRAVGSVAGGQ